MAASISSLVMSSSKSSEMHRRISEGPRCTLRISSISWILLLLSKVVRTEASTSALDAAIHFGKPTWPGAMCEFLCTEEVYPVASPATRDRFGLDDAAAIAQAPLLHQWSRPTAWVDWFAAGDLPTAGSYRRSRFDQFSMIAEAAVADMGVALMPRFMIEAELASGRLVLLTERPLGADKAYWFVYPEARVRSRLVRAFGGWLRTEATSRRL